eukprot:2056217-Amphidinium_carterae.1
MRKVGGCFEAQMKGSATWMPDLAQRMLQGGSRQMLALSEVQLLCLRSPRPPRTPQTPKQLK